MIKEFLNAENKLEFLLNNKNAIIILTIFCFPFGLYLLFKSKIISTKAKLIAIAICCFFVVAGYMKMQEDQRYFEENKYTIISELEELLEDGEAEEVLQEIKEEYLIVNDPELNQIKKKAKDIVEKHRKAERKAKQTEKEMAKRRSKIEAQFNKWDGSHINLVDKYLNQMHDPGSFEHVESRYIDNGETITVIMTCRGKNRLGSLSQVTVRAIVDINGNVLSFQ